jgi:pyruvate, orthophosphate dikinase
VTIHHLKIEQFSDVSMPSIHFIGTGGTDFRHTSISEVGAKAYNLMRMDQIGLPVPPGFVLGTEFCRACHERGGTLPDDMTDHLNTSVRRLENAAGRTFGGRRRPLLLAVRSGAPVSMPGMMDSILNIGLNEQTIHGLIRMTGNPTLAWDCYRRLTQSWGEIIGGLAPDAFERLVQARLDPAYCACVQELDITAMRQLTNENLDLIETLTKLRLPEDPVKQLSRAVEAVFKSWFSDRAVEYRRLNRIDDTLGTAVTVQTMVFGNAGGRSGSGVGFTRDPSTGTNDVYMDFLFNAQGEDVVAGRRNVLGMKQLQRVLPDVHDELKRVSALLENEFRDLQDFEFTIEEGRLYLLQTRTGKRTPWAAIQVAVDLVDQDLIDRGTALARLGEYDVDSIYRLRMEPEGAAAPLASASSASTGAVVGVIALDLDSARSFAATDKPVILVRDTLSTDDVGGLALASGLLTAHGGRTSHAAVVARQLGLVCLVGCSDLRIDLVRRSCDIGGKTLREGDYLSLDGDGGGIYAGELEVVKERPESALERIKGWRQDLRNGNRRNESVSPPKLIGVRPAPRSTR